MIQEGWGGIYRRSNHCISQNRRHDKLEEDLYGVCRLDESYINV